MNPLVLTYSHDAIFDAVKQETSLLAERRFDKDGNTLFEQLVFDEEYLVKFRELFFDAQAEITSLLARFTKDVPATQGYFETQNFLQDRNFELVLNMDDQWNRHLQKPLDIKIKQFLVSYIVYRWLETKSPQDAGLFLQRAESLKDDIRNNANFISDIYRRKTGYWEW
jgi:hypothetical protein